MSAPVAYRTVRHEPVLTFQWEDLSDEDLVQYRATGACPVCGCPMTHVYGFGQPLVGKGGFLGRREDPGRGVYHTRCRCESLHMPRPADVPSGCGAWLRIAAPPAGFTANGGGTP
ncbi:hypothetical protein ACIQNU_06835 [Streptomyces sp. NPDC091292]|uniref:hypothetical protein n=1 Tax=Streptomyces sp. NPDC091292 TaxID=3365991 RepID=UPI0038106E0C